MKLCKKGDCPIVNVSKNGRNAKIVIWITLLTSCVSAIFTTKSARFFVLRFWRGSGDLLQSCWEKLLDHVGEDPVTLWVYGPMAIMLVLYWGVGLIYIFMDVTNKPIILRKYKILPGTNEPVDSRKLCKAILQTLFNQTILTYPVGCLILWFMERRGYPTFRQLPALHEFVVDFALVAIIGEVVFYYSHRFLHLKPMYKYFHKQHHEWQSPISITAFYCHPVEHLIGNLAPLNIGYMIMGSHVLTAYVLYVIGVIDALNNHCGYHFPFAKSPEFHAFHHARFNECFGLTGVLDRIHGTDKKFRESVEYRRHSVMLHLVPPRELIFD